MICGHLASHQNHLNKLGYKPDAHPYVLRERSAR